jgi:hypothetical protein
VNEVEGCGNWEINTLQSAVWTEMNVVAAGTCLQTYII